jgi:hypothetical protein
MNVKANLSRMKQDAWNKMMVATVGSVEAIYWYDIYHLFAEEYDLM